MIPPIPIPPPTHEQTVEALAACGIPATRIRITYEDELRSDVVTIANLGGTDEKRLLCVRRSVHPFYILEIEDTAQRSAFYTLDDREDRREAKAEAIGWLGSAGMLDRVPRYDPARGLPAFARAVEGACGLSPGSALEPFGSSILTLRPGFFGENPKGAFDRFTCLSRMIAASNADEHDIHLAFIGNEALQDNQR